MNEVAVWYWFSCPECGYTWGSDHPNPDREWCANNCIVEPELIYEEQVQL